jgi:hypothetical protein
MLPDLLILSKDTPIAKVVNGELLPLSELLPLNEDRLPLILKRFRNAEAWLESRAIDRHRTNSRILKKALRLSNKEDVTAVLAVNACSITDNYWVRPLDDVGCEARNLGLLACASYKDVRFASNAFDKLALYGDVNSFALPPSRTPELTNTGSFEKCWRLENGEWWMHKAGKDLELYSELMAYEVGVALGLDMAIYVASGDFIKTLDFTGNAQVDFEPAAGAVSDASDYIKTFGELRSIRPELSEQYLLMCYFDALILNMDRHEHNFGLLRDSDTGEILKMAPLFDHNISLVARGYPQWAPKDILIVDFAKLLQSLRKPLKMRGLREAELITISEAVPFDLPQTAQVPNPKEFAAQCVLRRQEALKASCGDMLVLL